MKKTKMLALTLVVAIMLAGAGYAAWTEVIETDSVVRTGELNIEFLLEDALEASYDKGIRNVAGKGSINTLKDLIDVSVEEDQIEFSFNNLYPGASATTTFKIANNGTMAGFIEKAIVDITGDIDGDLYNAIEVDYKLIAKKADDTEVTLEDGTCKLNEMKELFFNDTNSPMIGNYVGVDEELYCQLTYRIPHNSLYDDQGENDELAINLKFRFVQANQYMGRVKLH